MDENRENKSGNDRTSIIVIKTEPNDFCKTSVKIKTNTKNDLFNIENIKSEESDTMLIERAQNKEGYNNNIVLDEDNRLDKVANDISLQTKLEITENPINEKYLSENINEGNVKIDKMTDVFHSAVNNSKEITANPRTSIAKTAYDSHSKIEKSVPKAKKKESTEKLNDSIVLTLTLDETEIGEISNVTESKPINEKPHKSLEVVDLVDKSRGKQKIVVNSEFKKDCNSEVTKLKANDNPNKTEGKEILSKTETSKFKNGTTEELAKSRVIWVSNLRRFTRATDLKEHLNKYGKVKTTKIVTDGRSCFGYVVFENYKDVINCLNNLNNSEYEGSKIHLSTSKPTIDIKSKAVEGEKQENKKDKEIKVNKRITLKNVRDKLKVKSSYRSNKRQRSKSVDPLTTTFIDGKTKCIKGEYLKEKQERERLKRKLQLETRRGREEMNWLKKKEERQNQMKIKLEIERKKLALEKELLEREKRDFMRLEEERRKIEKEKIMLIKKRTEHEKELYEAKRKIIVDDGRKSTKKQKIDGFRSFNTFDAEKTKKDEIPKKFEGYSASCRTKGGEIDKKRYFYKNINTVERHDKESKALFKKQERKFSRIPPSPPKLNDDFDIPKRKQLDKTIQSYGRKKSSKSPSIKHSFSYRKNEHDKPKPTIVISRDARSQLKHNYYGCSGRDQSRDARPELKHSHYGRSGRDQSRDARPQIKLNHYGRSGRDQRSPWSASDPRKTNTMTPLPRRSFIVDRYSETTGVNYDTLRIPTPSFYTTQPITVVPPEYKYYFDRGVNSRKY